MVLLVGAVALSGCATGQSQTDDPAADVDFGAETSISGGLSIMGFGLDDEIGQVRFDLAEEALAGTEVDLAEGGLDMQQFLSSVAAGNEPDLIRADRSQIGTLASRGAILPLTACVEEEGIDTDAFVDSAVQQVTFEDELYGIPEFNTVQVTMANQELLDEAGLSIEDVNGSDWDALTAASTALAQSSGGSVEVIGYDPKLPEMLPLWAQANGAALISEDGRTAQLDDPGVVEALEFGVGIYGDQGGFGEVKAYRDSADFFGEGNQFATGTLGAFPMDHWYANVLNEVSPDAPMAFDVVRDRDGEPLAYASGSAWAVPTGSSNPAAACRFANVMTQTDSWMAAAQERVRLREEAGLQFTGLLTGNSEADQQIREELVEPSGEERWEQATESIYEANDNTFSLPANPADAEFKQAWEDAVNRVLNGQQGPQEAMERAQSEAQKALDEAWATWDEQQEG